MAKIRGAREKRHAPYWDALLRGTTGAWIFAGGAGALAAQNVLFQTPGGGALVPTNMEAIGSWPSDQTYRILALRVGVYSLNVINGAGTMDDHIFQTRCQMQLFWDLIVAQKSAFQAFTGYLPLGGGLHGALSVPTAAAPAQYIINNGIPSAEAVSALARSIAIPARQNFRLVCSIIACGAENLLVDVPLITGGSAFVFACVDGLHVRDVL
jgi:hypothetical protein